MGKRLDEVVTLNHNSMVAQLSCLPITLLTFLVHLSGG